jgi:prepilin peptidase CpaA
MFAASPLGFLAGAVFSVLVALAAIEDVRRRRIPNVVVVPLAVLGLIYSTVVPPSIGGALRGIEGLLTGLVCWLPFYVFGWLGAGDVKLAAAAGAWLGPMRSVEGTLIAALLGAVVALVWMLRARGVKSSMETLGIATTLPGILAERPATVDRTRSLPYGVAMAGGVLAAAWLPGLLFS